MSDFILSCCSTADLSKEYFQRRNIYYICFHFEINGKSYPDDLGESIPFDEFYRRMAEGEMTKTSQINVSEYEEYFEDFLKRGKDIVHLSLSTGISGTFNSARVAGRLLEEKYPDRKIYVIDSLGASSGYGLLMDALADLRDQGKSAQEIAEFAEANKLLVRHWFFSTTLEYFVRGGRISKTSGFVGGLLNICPLMDVNNEGKLIPRFKIRTKQKVIKEIVNKMEETVQNGLDYDGKVFISNSGCPEDARAVARLVEERFRKLKEPVRIFDIGTTIGSHTGPGTVALFFWGTERGE